jgi:hypothetical protein
MPKTRNNLSLAFAVCSDGFIVRRCLRRFRISLLFFKAELSQSIKINSSLYVVKKKYLDKIKFMQKKKKNGLLSYGMSGKVFTILEFHPGFELLGSWNEVTNDSTGLPV